MTTPMAFSYSRLNSFEQCPKKFHAVNVAKTFKEVESEPMAEGKRVHKALELRIKSNTKLPPDLVKHEPTMQRIAAAPGLKLTEFQMSITDQFKPVSWFDKNTYCRAVADLAVVNGDKAAVFDYKTGKPSDDFTQMRLTGAVFFQHYEKVNRIQLVYVWLKNKTLTQETMLRSDIPDVWSSLLPRINNYQAAAAAQDYPPKPGWQCRSCPVKTCPYWEGK